MLSIEEILRAASEAGASDVHITVGIPPKMRVNGSLIAMEYPKLLPADTLDIMLNVMTENQRDRFEEQGECDLSFSAPSCGRSRVSVFRQKGAVALVFRLVGKQIPSLEELGIPDCVAELCNLKKGLVLITGPSGSGRSTTLASLIDRINQYRDAHIITLEDPIEYYHQHKMSIVSQREIGSDSLSYANAMRAALREDPDVIQIGEMNDADTISAAVDAAEAGHLVFAVLNTMDAESTLDRILNVFPQHRQQQMSTLLANVLEAVVSQQLLPTIEGKERTAAFEVMLSTKEIKNLIREAKPRQLIEVMRTSRVKGMHTKDDDIARLYMEGKIGHETALQFARDLDKIQDKL